MIEWDNPFIPIQAQQLAVAWLEWACDGSRGVDEQHPRYRRVTEGRDTGATYSSCGDLAHWMFYRLGVRERWINRAEHSGWRTAQNVSLLAFNRLSQIVEDDLFVEPGDVFIIWNRADGTDAHVLVAIDRSGKDLLTAEYGQPGGALRKRKITPKDGALFIGDRRIQRRLPLLTVLSVAQETGNLVAAEEPPPAPPV